MVKITINLSNRWLYTIIAISVLIIISVGVYALAPGASGNPGHNIQNIGPPVSCSDGQILRFIDSTDTWDCVAIVDVNSVDGLSGGTITSDLQVTGEVSTTKFSTGYREPAKIITGNSVSSDWIYDSLSPYLLNLGDKMIVSGFVRDSAGQIPIVVSYAQRSGSDRISIYGFRLTQNVTGGFLFTDGDTSNLYGFSLAW